MSNATSSIQSLDRLRARAIAALVPFFVDGPTSNLHSARTAAESLLDSYSATTPRELQLATQIIAFGWAAMACLQAAATAKNLSIDDTLRLQDDAIGLDGSSQRAIKSLEARRKGRTNNPKIANIEDTKWDEGVFQLAINQALDKLSDANAKVAADTASLGPVTPKPGLPVSAGEQMTRSVLAKWTNFI
jgi:hypothetical protein